jgi:hypothetical protein
MGSSSRGWFGCVYDFQTVLLVVGVVAARAILSSPQSPCKVQVPLSSFESRRAEQ